MMRRVLGACLLSLVAFPAAGAPARVGIFIGSNAAPEGRTELQHAKADALRMRRVFVELGGIAAADAHLLEDPTADEIIDAIKRVDPEAGLLVFYYSGHADERSLLLNQSELSFIELTKALEESDAQLSLHLVDACRSGALTRRKGASLGQPFDVDAHEYGEGKVVITSSAEWEDSHESDRIQGSFFTLHMATGLRGAADTNGDGKVTLGEAYEYVYGRTVESTLASHGGVQHPTFAYDLSGQGDLVMSWPDRAGGTVVFGRGDYVVLEDRSGRVAAEITTPDAKVSLPAGTYRIRKRARFEVRSGDLTMKVGDTVRADDVLTDREAYARLVRKGGPKDPVAAHAIRVMGGVRGRVADGLGAAPIFRIGYELSLPWLSVMPYVAGTTNAAFGTPRLTYASRELAVGLAVSRAYDTSYFTLRGGLMAEGLRFTQTEATGKEPDRSSWAGAFAVQAGVESPPFLGDFNVALIGEAALYVYRASTVVQEPTGVGEVESKPAYRMFIALGYEL